MVTRKSKKQPSTFNAVTVLGYRIGNQPMEVAYSVRDRHPIADGPWMEEADKVAWTDPATAYPCIIRREQPGGHLAGFVAIPTTHPLYGHDASVLATLGIRPHGGAGYADECMTEDPEETSVCHVRVLNLDPAGRSGGRHDDAWWFGFSCNTSFDIQPISHEIEPAAISVGLEREYRDESYVMAHVIDLAAQLEAVARGEDVPPARAPGPPPIGLNPKGPKGAL